MTRPTPLVRAGLMVLAAFTGALIGLGTVAETRWPLAPTVGIAVAVAAAAAWWSTR